MANASRLQKRRTPAQRQEILNAYRRTPLSQREFARQAGVGLTTLQYWLRNEAVPRQQAAPSFVEIPHRLAPPVSPPRYRLQLPKGIHMEVESGFVSEEVAALLRILASV
ncbi:MAG: hypothetical protein KBB56_14670 [Acidobacteria bacterium]|nr:hypothetical protein [Acidobacteriota bacterium]